MMKNAKWIFQTDDFARDAVYGNASKLACEKNIFSQKKKRHEKDKRLRKTGVYYLAMKWINVLLKESNRISKHDGHMLHLHGHILK